MNTQTKTTIFLLLLLTGCASAHKTPPEPSSTYAPQITATDASMSPYAPSDNAEILLPPSPTLGPTPTIVFDAGPDIPSRILNDPLFSGETSDCLLPCWNNLRIGSSTLADIQGMFDNIFEFHGRVNFSANKPTGNQILVSEFPNSQTVGYSWTMNQGDNSIALELVTDQSKVLQGIVFRDTHTAYSPEQIIRKLGTPDAVWTSITVQTEESGKDFAIVGLILAYKNGLLFRYSAASVVANKSFKLFYCLEKPASTSFQILDSFGDFSEENASDLQIEWLYKPIRRAQLRTLQDAVGITSEEFANIALSDSPCIYVPHD